MIERINDSLSDVQGLENRYGKPQISVLQVWREDVRESPISAKPNSPNVALLRRLARAATKGEPLVIVATALLLYSAFASCSFNEGDSFNFAKALVKFDIVAEQPHSPGYPLYIFLGRAFFLLTGNQHNALVWISVASGALTLLPLYFLAKEMYGRAIAVTTCLVLMVLPGFWLLNEKATTDALSTFLLTLGVVLLYFGRKGNSRAMLLSTMVYALSIGVRPPNLAFLALWLYVGLCKRNLRDLVLSILVFLLTVAAWLVPVVWVTGWDEFLSATRHVYVGTANTDFILAKPLGLDPYERFLFAVASVFTFALGGMLPPIPGLKFPFTSTNIPAYYILHDTVWLSTLFCAAINFRKIVEKMFAFLWIVPHFVFVYLFGSPIHHRYYLPIFPPLVLLVVSSLMMLIDRGGSLLRFPNTTRKLARYIGPSFLVLTLIAHTMPLAERLHTEPAPVTQLVKYVKANYDPSKVVIIVFHEYGAFEMFAEEFRYYHSRKGIREALRTLANSSSDHTLLVTSTAYEYLVKHPSVLRLEIERIAEFYLDPRAEIEDHRVILYKVHVARVSNSTTSSDPELMFPKQMA